VATPYRRRYADAIGSPESGVNAPLIGSCIRRGNIPGQFLKGSVCPRAGLSAPSR
jgi:hypothetical protein